MLLIFLNSQKKLETSIFYFFALPPTLMRNTLDIKISKQRGESKKYSIHKMKNSQKDTVFFYGTL